VLVVVCSCLRLLFVPARSVLPCPRCCFGCWCWPQPVAPSRSSRCRSPAAGCVSGTRPSAEAAWEERSYRVGQPASTARRRTTRDRQGRLQPAARSAEAHEKPTPAQPTARARRRGDLRHRRGDLRACFKLVGVSRHGDSETAPGVDARPEVLPLALANSNFDWRASGWGRELTGEWSAPRGPELAVARAHVTHHLGSMAWLERCSCLLLIDLNLFGR
jgi:hypothetical protein